MASTTGQHNTPIRTLQGGATREYDSGATCTKMSGSTTTYQSGSILDLSGTIKIGGTANDRLVKTARVVLAALDTAGGVVSWANPEASSILIQRILLDVTTKSTGACTLDIGVAASATTSGDNLLDGVDVGTAVGLFDNVSDIGSNGKSRQKMTTAQFVTASKASGAAAGLVGFIYIQYLVV